MYLLIPSPLLKEYVYLLDNDIIDPTDSSQPFSHSLTDADVGHMACQLTDAGEYCWLEGCECLVWQGLDLVENSQHHISPGLK